MNLNTFFVLFFGWQGIIYSALAIITFSKNCLVQVHSHDTLPLQSRWLEVNKLISKELGDISFKALTCWALFRLFTVIL